MDLIFSPPVQPIGSSYPQKKTFVKMEMTHTKVKGLVLDKIKENLEEMQGALLPTNITPKIVLSTFQTPALYEQKEIFSFRKERRRARVKRVKKRLAPIGLKKCDPYGWMNSFMQFLLFMPHAQDIFSFISRSFEPFREFTDMYYFDSLNQSLIASSSGEPLLLCLRKIIPFVLLKIPQKIDLYPFFQTFIKLAFPDQERIFFKSVFFCNKWHLKLDKTNVHVKEAKMSALLDLSPPEFLVSIHSDLMMECKKEHFILKERNSYQLDGFIEKRPDVASFCTFITYLKVEGVWYQCEDERVQPLLSTSLQFPLQRSVLLHYSQMHSKV